MRKSMIALVGTGLGGCLLTTAMMGHLLSMEPDMKLTGEIAERFEKAFADRSERDAALVIKRPGKDEVYADEDSAIRVVARIWPKKGVDLERMIGDVADFVWNQDFGDPIHEVQVRWPNPKTKRTERRIVGRSGKRRILRLYGSSSGR